MSKPAPPSDPRFLRLLKTPKKKEKAAGKEEELFSQKAASEQASSFQEKDDPLLILAESDEDIVKWIKRKTPQPDFRKAVNLFNLINLGINPDAPYAQRLTLTVLKGTSFEDKRETCLEVIQKIRLGEHTGEIELIHSPYEDQLDPSRNDPWAMKAVAKGYPEEKFLGYIPKAQGTNESFCRAIEAGMFCGAYIITAKKTNFQGQENQIITVLTGWTEKKQA